MRHPDIEYMVVMERRREELAAAAQSRLVKEALEAERLNNGPKKVSLLYRAAQGLALLAGRGLYWFGERIRVWGCRLQYRYALNGMQAEPAPCE